MKHAALAAIVLFLSAGSVPAREQTTPPASASAPNAQQGASQPLREPTPFQNEMIHARILMATKDYDEAIPAYTKMTVEYPNDAAVWNMLGIALQQTGRNDDARSAYTRATKLDKKYAEAYNNIGTTWYQQQNYKKAIRAYQRALAADPDLATAYGNLAYAYFSDKKYPQALAALNQALSLDPNVFVLSGYAGTILQDRSVSDSGSFYFMVAKSYAQRNDAVHCAEYLRKAFDEGYKSVISVRTDPSFSKVIGDPGVRTIVDKAEANPAGKPGVSPGS